MQFRFIRGRDTISPSLMRALRTGGNARPVLQAAGLVIEARAKRAFDEPGLRPAAWAALKPSTLRAKAAKNLSSQILRANGTLWRSIRITELLATRVTVGTDRFYAKFHQLGTKRMPARPFFPFLADGRLVPAAKARVELAMRRKLAQGGIK